MVQYRDKQRSASDRMRAAGALVELCHQHGIPLIVNDDIELAREVGAAGVHLGQEDAALEQARHRLGDQAIIGVSCYNSLEQARLACGNGGYAAGALQMSARRFPWHPLGRAY